MLCLVWAFRAFLCIKLLLLGPCICGELGVGGVDWIGSGCVCMKDISFA